LQDWVEEAKAQLAFNTYRSYHNIITKHVLPKIGRKKLIKLSPMDVQRMITQLREEGIGGRALQLSYEYLNRAMRKAYRYRTIQHNPCEPVDKPKHDPRKIDPFTVDQMKLILKAASDHMYYCLYYTALTTGMRSGELFGLFWDSVELNKKQIHVVQQLSRCEGGKEIKKLKTDSSYRTIDISDQTVAMLLRQRKWLIKHGYASSRHVFCGRDGALVNRGSFTRIWNNFLTDLGIKQRGFHHMRHTFATLALSSGVPVTVVSATLGHASTAMTLDIYSHVLPSMKSDATNAVSKLIG
ncbi:MAG: tyrosine-type recombinase/integrase, partial [Planctomycetota bacterium]